MARRLTEVNGLTLDSEFADPELYDRIRSLQFLFLHTYKLGAALKILEVQMKKRGFYYAISNQESNLFGFVGRDVKTKEIFYLVKDWSRLKWLREEGFEPNEENYQKVGVMAKCKRMEDFILFMANQKGFDFVGYAKV
jgi:hypothetical protein